MTDINKIIQEEKQKRTSNINSFIQNELSVRKNKTLEDMADQERINTVNEIKELGLNGQDQINQNNINLDSLNAENQVDGENFYDSLKRGGQLAFRSAVEGLTAVPSIVLDPINLLTGQRLASDTIQDLLSNVAKPETGTEKAIFAGAEGLIGFGAPFATGLKITKTVADEFADNLPLALRTGFKDAISFQPKTQAVYASITPAIYESVTNLGITNDENIDPLIATAMSMLPLMFGKSVSKLTKEDIQMFKNGLQVSTKNNPNLPFYDRLKEVTADIKKRTNTLYKTQENNLKQLIPSNQLKSQLFNITKKKLDNALTTAQKETHKEFLKKFKDRLDKTENAEDLFNRISQLETYIDKVYNKKKGQNVEIFEKFQTDFENAINQFDTKNYSISGADSIQFGDTQKFKSKIETVNQVLKDSKKLYKDRLYSKILINEFEKVSYLDTDQKVLNKVQSTARNLLNPESKKGRKFRRTAPKEMIEQLETIATTDFSDTGIQKVAKSLSNIITQVGVLAGSGTIYVSGLLDAIQAGSIVGLFATLKGTVNALKNKQVRKYAEESKNLLGGKGVLVTEEVPDPFRTLTGSSIGFSTINDEE